MKPAAFKYIRVDTVEAVLREADRLRSGDQPLTVELCTNGRTLDPGRRRTLDRVQQALLSWQSQ